jgi:hypothetical protein
VLGADGHANRLFLMYLLLDKDVAIHFLKDTGLIRTQMPCSTCGRILRGAFARSAQTVTVGNVAGASIQSAIPTNPFATGPRSNNLTLHSTRFCSGAHTNTIECQWRHLKANLNPYNRLSDYLSQLAHHIFAAR